MQSLHFDDANADDIPQLVDLLHTLFTIEDDFSPDTQKQRLGLEMLIANPVSGVIKVARNVDGNAIGMVSAQLVISTAEGAYSAWIEDMVIAPGYRGQGIGRMLLRYVLQWAKAQGATRAQLLVDLANDSAIDYYRHLGWQPTQLQARRILL
ncbi:MAG TPA: GNAT family N-acetyltransferase [Methylophilaceae bacterium]|nr:GNAT family N-acetyltransferase [Methylophilaceae bacterium]